MAKHSREMLRDVMEKQIQLERPTTNADGAFTSRLFVRFSVAVCAVSMFVFVPLPANMQFSAILIKGGDSLQETPRHFTSFHDSTPTGPNGMETDSYAGVRALVVKAHL